jgi:hypothetical protein
VEDGTVLVLLKVDGMGFDIVFVDDGKNNGTQLDKGIEALTKARDALR